MKSHSIKVKTLFETNAVAKLVQTASQYESLISLTIGNKTANAKSIMGLLSLGLTDGQEVNVSAEGADEEKAAREVSGFLQNYTIGA